MVNEGTSSPVDLSKKYHVKFFGLTFVNGESDIIMSISDGHPNYVKRGVDIVRECEVDPDFEDMVDVYNYWTTLTITLPEEPVRFAFSSSIYAAASEIYTFS